MNWKSISKELKGKTYFGKILKQYASFQIGGEVALFVEETNSQDLIEDLTFFKAEGIPYKILGNATNLLISDSFLDYVVVKMNNKQIDLNHDNVIVDAGINGNFLINKLKTLSLGGLEFMAGIPGSVGGMVKLNAGAFGNEICNFVESVMLENGEWTKNFKFSYRYTNINGVIVKVKLKLLENNEQTIDKKIKSILSIRKNTQPTLPSAGSIFKKPRPDFYVGKAIDDLGLKGYRIGDAMISKVHAGFIVNVGNAKFDDVIKLIDFIRNEIFKAYNETLDLEINIWR